MSDDQNQPQNSIPEENPSPISPKEPTEQAPENTAHSEPTEVPSEALESSPSDFEVKSTDIPPSNSTPAEAENELKTEEKSSENKAEIEPVSEQKQEVPEPETAQIPVNEPLESKTENPEPGPEKKISYLKSQKLNELLVSARNAIQFRKRKKLNKIMSLFLEKSKITNDEVEKLLHVSDATATRYLSILEKENKIQQSGKTGKGVTYTRV